MIHYIPNPNYYDTTQKRIYINVDNEGKFSLNLGQTNSILVGLEAPAGYYSGASSGGDFSFNEIPESTPPEIRKHAIPPHRPDSNHPVVFTLVKMGRTEPMIERSQSAVLLEGKEFQIGNDRTHQVAIKLWVAPDVKPLSGIGGYEVHDWGVELSVLNGGLIERENPKSKDSGTFLAQQKVINKSFGWNIPIK